MGAALHCLYTENLAIKHCLSLSFPFCSYPKVGGSALFNTPQKLVGDQSEGLLTPFPSQVPECCRTFHKLQRCLHSKWPIVQPQGVAAGCPKLRCWHWRWTLASTELDPWVGDSVY